MKTVLLTGATGFIGRHCLEPLWRRGFAVHAVTSRTLPVGQTRPVWHRADLLDPEQVRCVVTAVHPSHLLHLAWEVTPGEYWNSPANLRWVQGSLELLRTFVEGRGQRATLMGTCAEYDWSRSGEPCGEERTPLGPASLYGASKHAMQLMLASLAGHTGLSASWGRLFFLYGPHEHPGRLVPSVIRPILRGEPALCAAGAEVRDFLYVEDVGDALAALLDSDVTGPVNIGSGVPVSVKNLVMCIGERLDRPDLVRLGALPARPGEPARLVADVRRLTHEVGWRPRRDLAEGLDETIAWWRRQP